MNSFRTLVALVVFISMMMVATRGDYQSPIGGTAGSSQPVCYSHWQSVGPFHVAHRYDGINELTDPEDIGAVQDVIVVGTKAYAASVNGGIWRTNDITSTATFFGPHWESVTGTMPCTSMSSVAASPDDSNLIVAGCGFPSNSASRGSEPLGAMISTDGGDTWTMTGFPKGFWISTVLVSGTGSTAKIIISAKQPIYPYSGTTGSTVDSYNVGNTKGGIWHSTNAGVSFTQTYSAEGVNFMTPHSTTAGTYYAGVKYTSGTAGSFTTNPVLVSTNYGATWAPTTAAPSIGTQCSSSTVIASTKLSMSGSNLYAGYYMTDGGSNYCYCVFYTSNGGTTWTNIPNVPTGGRDLGGQGDSNFAILAAPTDPTTLFVAGTGSLAFRVSISTNVWTIISTISGYDPSTDAPSYTTTTSSTAPHADARTFCWEPNTGSLLLTDDGGVYKRTTPLSSTNAGDWSSLAGDMAITEGYQVAVDPVSGAQMLAAQDNSVMFSQFDATEKTTGIWNYLQTGDGSGALIDSSTTPAQFYGGDQYMGGLFKIAVNANSGGAGVVAVSHEFPTSVMFGTCSMGDSSCLNFQTGLTVNKVTSSNLLICTVAEAGYTDSKCYKLVYTTSTHTATELEFYTGNYPSITNNNYYVESYVYGGRKNGATNANVIMAISRGFIWSRSSPCTNPSGSFCTQSYTGSCSVGCTNMVNIAPPWKNGFFTCALAQHPQDYFINSVADDAGHIWLTVDFGQTWKDLNLVGNSNLLSITGHTTVDTFLTGVVNWVDIDMAGTGIRPFIVGVGNGLFVSFDAPTASYFTFAKLGANQPITASTTLIYVAAQDSLIASVFGRGVWALQRVGAVLYTAYAGNSTTTLNPACTQPLYPNVPNAYGYISSGVLPAPIGFPTIVSSSSTGSAGTTSSSSSSTGSASGSGTSSTAASTSTASGTTSSSSTAAGTVTAASSSTGPTGGVNGTSSSTGPERSSSDRQATASMFVMVFLTGLLSWIML